MLVIHSGFQCVEEHRAEPVLEHIIGVARAASGYLGPKLKNAGTVGVGRRLRHRCGRLQPRCQTLFSILHPIIYMIWGYYLDFKNKYRKGACLRTVVISSSSLTFFFASTGLRGGPEFQDLWSGQELNEWLGVGPPTADYVC